MRIHTSYLVICRALLFASAIALASCASSNLDLDNDPDLLTDQDEIPERPGLIEATTGEKLEKSWQSKIKMPEKFSGIVVFKGD